MSIKRGIRYPLEIVNGSLAVSTDFDLLGEAIFSVLETRPGERIMNAQYGTPNYIFDTVRDPGVICEQIRISLVAQIPEIDRFAVTGRIDEDGVMDIQVAWIADTIEQPAIAFKLVV